MIKYVCRRCGYEEEAERWLWKCPKCGSPLSVEGDIGEKKVTLGEGNTPLVRLFGMGESVRFKLDYLNPTGSFKDRGTSVALSEALKRSIGCVVEDSSGNAGISVAAYSAASGIWATVVVPKDAPEGKKKLIEALGADLVEAEDRQSATSKAMELEAKGCAYVGHQWNPWFIRGVEGIADEITKNLGRVPEAVVFPTSSGTLLLGLYYGFKKLDKMPRLFAVQASGFSPLYESIHGKSNLPESSVADALRVQNPPRLEEMKEAVLKSKGDALVVSDKEIISALSKLLKAGALVEPSSAAALAGYYKLLEGKQIDKGSEVVVILTGSGLKYSDVLSSLS